jgi:hypothetical protein
MKEAKSSSKSGIPQRDAGGRLNAMYFSMKGLFLVAMLLGVLSETGCTNLGAVRDFAAISSQSHSVQLAAAELADSPQRQLQYALDDSTKSIYQASVTLGMSNQVALVAAYGIIQSYMTTLGTLAGDGILASNTIAIGNFAQVISTQSFIKDTNAVDAYGKIASLISKAIIDLYRQSKVRKMIEDVHDSFPVAVSNLEHVVTVDCVLQLSAETNMLNSYYIYSTQLNSANTPPWAQRLVMDSYNAKMEELLGKIHDCNECGLALGKIAAGYQLMYDNRDHLDAKEFESTLKSYEQDIMDAYTSIKKLK